MLLLAYGTSLVTMFAFHPRFHAMRLQNCIFFIVKFIKHFAINSFYGIISAGIYTTIMTGNQIEATSL